MSDNLNETETSDVVNETDDVVNVNDENDVTNEEFSMEDAVRFLTRLLSK